ncbi:hypothetical protein F2Q69_00022722 [Brassica cretica]|uniref:Uncharacterized protein n=1 Tax=Brassica cretica TaxID=69181 RepID=A0A8S9QCX4_BRACR|nr:hypothetical protein F2Q69_00022722 [Brassica cretica]
MIETGPIEESVHKSETSHLAVPEHLRPPICTEEAARIHKRVKRIHDPVRIMVPCDVFEAESPIPPDRSIQFSSYIEVLDYPLNAEACQRGYHHAIRQVYGKEEEELEEEKKDQGRSSVIIDSSLFRRCQEIQSAQQMLLTANCKASSTPYC